ncbi:hypothetical protein [Spiroplasma endosymbiont of Phycita roborella]|uniref:hypothetical protein n=1 Tax=Spiroplasma endosymbiont of Phycita roborella TaxID=3066311 RepID=UPI00313E16A3
MQKVNEWINKHQHEFKKTLEEKNQIKINWEQEYKIMGGCQSYEIINYHISNLFPKLPFKNDDRQIKGNV